MEIYYNPDDYGTIYEFSPCWFHKKYPNKYYPGCTCVGNMFMKKKTEVILDNMIEKYKDAWERLAKM